MESESRVGVGPLIGAIAGSDDGLGRFQAELGLPVGIAAVLLPVRSGAVWILGPLPIR